MKTTFNEDYCVFASVKGGLSEKQPFFGLRVSERDWSNSLFTVQREHIPESWTRFQTKLDTPTDRVGVVEEGHVVMLVRGSSQRDLPYRVSDVNKSAEKPILTLNPIKASHRVIKITRKGKNNEVWSQYGDRECTRRKSEIYPVSDVHVASETDNFNLVKPTVFKYTYGD